MTLESHATAEAIPRSDPQMGKTTVTVDVVNANDLGASEAGLIPAHQVRHEQVLFTVDTGATLISLPLDIIERLGLQVRGNTTVTTANGVVGRRILSAVYIEIMGRHAEVGVVEHPIGVPPLLGVVPLEMLDLIVNPGKQRLEGNPEHGGEYMIESY